MSSPRLFKQLFSLPIGGADATTTILNGSPSGFTLPSTTIVVNSTSGFTSSGLINVVSINTVAGIGTVGSNNTITYTGIVGNTFTGCTGGTGTVFNGAPVTQISNSPVFNANWIAPPGVKWVIVTGCGGGGGGGSGASNSSTNNAYPLFVWVIAGGGGGGQSAMTSTHVVPVVPGVSYPVSIGLGGLGGPVNYVFNGAPNPGPNNYGGTAWGQPGSSGQNSLFGTIIFPGGQGGRRGEILQRGFVANEIDYGQYTGTGFPGSNSNSNFDPGANPIGGTQFNTAPVWPNPVLGGQIVQARSYGIWNPPGLVTSQFTLDQVVTQGIINNSQSLVANSAAPGLSNLWTGGGVGAGGGGGGGTSNNIYSVGGTGGQGAQGVAGYPFSVGGNSGIFGGGGGGGGGGEGLNYNNTHDGAPGGNGGVGFIEIAWMQ